jgi:hypothetical protein
MKPEIQTVANEAVDHLAAALRLLGRARDRQLAEAEAGADRGQAGQLAAVIDQLHLAYLKARVID